MIKIENVVLPSPAQWEAVIRGMRNPKNSWERSDSFATHIEDSETLEISEYEFFVGEQDYNLMEHLALGGPVHAKYRRMIPVYLDVTAPLYWWKEFDTYKVGTVANSCSTMHKIHEKEFTIDDFSCENLLGLLQHFDEREIPYIDISVYNDRSCEYSPLGIMSCIIIPMLNECRQQFLETKDKCYWWQMIQLLPSSYNQKRTVMLNYEVLVGIYEHRKNHKLDEWREFCKWIEGLPYSELITGSRTCEPEV